MLTKSALAAALLAILTVTAQAQQGLTRQIEVLPAPGQQAQAQLDATATDGAAAQGEAPAGDAAPKAEPKAEPKILPKIAEPKGEFKGEPKFVEPKFVEKRERFVREHHGYRNSYASYGYGKRAHCH